MFRRLVLPVLVLLGLLLPGRAAVVSNLTQAAFEAAVAQGGTVTFASSGTINLTNQVLVLRDTIIDARGVASLILNATATNRLFYVTNGVQFTVIATSLRNGRAPFGGAIWNDGGTLLLRSLVVSGNQAIGRDGTNGFAAGEHASSGAEARGGAIYSSGPVILTNVSFSGNSATGGKGGNGAQGRSGSFGQSGGNGGNGAAAWGGAIFAESSITANLVSFSGNSATAGAAGAGGPVGVGSLGIQGIPGQGGLAANAAGGAIFALGTVSATNVTFSGNTATASAGGHGTTDLAGNDGGDASGGALHLEGPFSFLNATFSDNRAVGGQGGNGGNSRNGIVRAARGGHGGDALGGAVFTFGAGQVRYTTWATNAAILGTNGPSGGGGAPPDKPGIPGLAKGGSLANSNLLGSVALNSTLLGNGFPTNAWGAILDAGYNLSSDRSILWTQPTSRLNLNPQLEPLQQNNGVLLTVGFRTNSPAIDAADPATMPLSDARGTLRPLGAGPDIGAFELAPVFPLQGRLTEVYLSNGKTNLTNVLSGYAVWADNVRALTDTNGFYAFTNLQAGTYTVYPTNLGAGFNPALRLVTLGLTNAANPSGGATNVDFAANRPVLRITGVPRFLTTNTVLTTNGSTVTTNRIISTNGNFLVLTNLALPSRSYRVQVNTNLVSTNWLTIATNTTGAVAVGTTTVSNFPGGAPRYFRLVAP